MINFKNKKILVTGATGGIGREVVKKFISLEGNVVATGTTCVDNIYFVNSFNASTMTVICNVDSGINSTGISTSTYLGLTCGSFSWGKLSGFTRSANPVSIGVTGMTVDVGLSTYPTIQRRDYGLRDSGAVRKDLG